MRKQADSIPWLTPFTWWRVVGLWVLMMAMIGSAQAMIYRPEAGKAMWDPGVFWHDGTYYMFAMYGEGTQWPDSKSGYLATSKDGVHWEHGWTVTPEPEFPKKKFFKGYIAWIGDRFIMNHGVAPEPGQPQDTLRFYESPDLKEWKNLYNSHPDYELYNPGRWDDMYFLPKNNNDLTKGFWGIATAVPKPPTANSFGLLESKDGVNFVAVQPPDVEYGELPGYGYEAGGAERIGNRYYFIGGNIGYLGNEGYAMFSLWADDMRGPFHADAEAFRLCGHSNKRAQNVFVTALASWGRDEDNNPIISNTVMTDTSTWLLPLRKPVIEDGHLRLGWWKNNEKLKGEKVDLKRSKFTLKADNDYGILEIPETFDPRQGVIIEGEIKAEGDIAGFYLPEANSTDAVAILHDIGEPKGRETNIVRLVDNQGKKTSTLLDLTGKHAATVTGLLPGKKHSFRILLRVDVFDLYIDDLLMQTYVYKPGDKGRFGFIVKNAKATISDLKMWKMSLKPYVAADELQQASSESSGLEPDQVSGESK